MVRGVLLILGVWLTLDLMVPEAIRKKLEHMSELCPFYSQTQVREDKGTETSSDDKQKGRNITELGFLHECNNTIMISI